MSWFDCNLPIPFGRVRSNNTHKRVGYILSLLGCSVIDAGWPDLLVERDGEIFGLEVKGPRDRLSGVQKRLHEKLRKAGIQVGVAYVNERGIIQKITDLEIKD